MNKIITISEIDLYVILITPSRGWVSLGLRDVVGVVQVDVTVLQLEALSGEGERAGEVGVATAYTT
jgi:hypothetical protein